MQIGSVFLLRSIVDPDSLSAIFKRLFSRKKGVKVPTDNRSASSTEMKQIGELWGVKKIRKHFALFIKNTLFVIV